MRFILSFLTVLGLLMPIVTDAQDRLQIGGYGEVIGTYNFFSDEYLRYTDATSYKDAPGHGRIDIPHFVIWLGYVPLAIDLAKDGVDVSVIVRTPLSSTE